MNADRGVQQETNRANLDHGAGEVLAATRGRIVACRGASTGTRGRVGEVGHRSRRSLNKLFDR